MELCWLTTEKCNQRCNYCDRFSNCGELSTEEYHKILDKLISYNVKKMTFGGGESLMVSCFADIVKKGARNGFKFKLGTNGKLLPQNAELIPLLAEITLSLDSVDPDINEKLGRGYDHLENIRRAISVIESCSPRPLVNINTVVTKINLARVKEMANFIAQLNIEKWRIFRFCPLRGTAVRNRAQFEITEEQFQKIRAEMMNLDLKCKVQFRDYEDMETKYLLITPNGKLYVSRDLKDVEVGDMLREDLRRWFTFEEEL